MKAYLIKVSAPGPFKEYKKAMGAPPQNIFSLAAATPESVSLELCDETVGMKPKLRTDADIVALLFHTPDAPHAYKLADSYRAKGKTVVLGGLHTSFMPDEAGAHADTVMVGEAEGIWELLLNDYQQGDLKPRYKRSQLVDLATVNPYPTNLIPPSRYKHFWSVLVSRGCGNRCEFCAVPPFFQGKFRLRPVEKVVSEIKAAPRGCWFELHSDSLTANRKYALELFKALAPLKINWMGEATLELADDEELLQTAAESGCKGLLVGIETSSSEALKTSGKGFVDPDSAREKLRRFHGQGIAISSSMIFGFDSHTTDIFKESEEFCRYIEIDEVQPVILIPFPGTPLYTRLDSEDRLLSNDWSKYDGSHAVFRPKNMTPQALEDGATWFWYEVQKKKVTGKADNGSGNVEPPSGPKRGGPNKASAPILTSGSFPLTRWKSIIALAAIGFGFFCNWYWVWGVLFLLWVMKDLYYRSTYLMDEIPREQSPVLYWLVILMWLILGLWALGVWPTP